MVSGQNSRIGVSAGVRKLQSGRLKILGRESGVWVRFPPPAHPPGAHLNSPGADVIVSVTDTISMSRPADLVQGTLDALILQTLALEPLHGLAVAQRMRARSGDVLNVSRGSLYPALHKLEQQGLLRAEWRLAESGKGAEEH